MVSRNTVRVVERRFWLGWVVTLATLGTLDAQTPRQIMRQAEADFLAGRLEASVTGFDQVARALPEAAPQFWQRGIALYYVGRYTDCRRQFESHRLVNPNDVENAAWHFLCVAREESPEEALAALLPVGPDPRAPMGAIYEMFRGRMSPEAVLSAAPDPRARFYAHLYRGLYHEAYGRTEAAGEEIALAADERFARVGGYMHGVAVVHRDRLVR
ncbi:MAG: hypothetical protein CL484_12850 [Acidobacteria bacterium]|nr:hypothetical protein [Acidobacteriota bacterium]